MHVSPSGQFQDPIFSIEEVAEAAGVTVFEVRALLAGRGLASFGEFVPQGPAVQLVRALTRRPAHAPDQDREFTARPPLTLLAQRPARTAMSLVASGAAHALMLLLLVTLASLGLFNATYTDQTVLPPTNARLVFLMSPGPGGGGGGGGLKMPEPPPPAAKKAERKESPSPVPPPRKVVPPPRPDPPRRPPPIDPPKIEPQPIETPKPVPAPAIQAPVVPIAADPVDVTGLPVEAKPSPSASNGPGAGGGVGSGTGAGLGEGQGAGIGPGSGGGTGGGPFQPGSGIEPPVLLREVRPLYTDEARRRAIEGDVILEIVVRQDGSVGNVRVTRSLGAGLEQRAVEAVRQWRFGPAKRRGAPVDVVVEVSVEFKLR
jgi:TonB family protein